MHPDKLLLNEDEALAAALQASMSEMTVVETTEADEEDEVEAGVGCEKIESKKYWREMLHPSADHMKFAREAQTARLREESHGPPTIEYRALKEPTRKKYDAIFEAAGCDGGGQKAAAGKIGGAIHHIELKSKSDWDWTVIEGRNDCPLKVPSDPNFFITPPQSDAKTAATGSRGGATAAAGSRGGSMAAGSRGISERELLAQIDQFMKKLAKK